VQVFIKNRFPFILVLNKVDTGGDTDTNALRISERYDERSVSLCSALSECFLQRMRAQKYIYYEEGSMFFSTHADPEGEVLNLKAPDPKLESRLEKIRDLVLFRYGSTGVHKALNLAVELAGLIPVYPVKNVRTFGDRSGEGAFAECVLLPRGTTVRQFAKMLHTEIDRNYIYAEGPNSIRLGENDEITPETSVIRFVTTPFADA